MTLQWLLNNACENVTCTSHELKTTNNMGKYSQFDVKLKNVKPFSKLYSDFLMWEIDKKNLEANQRRMSVWIRHEIKHIRCNIFGLWCLWWEHQNIIVIFFLLFWCEFIDISFWVWIPLLQSPVDTCHILLLECSQV